MAVFNIVSIGKAAAELQAPVERIRRAADSLGIALAGRINGVPHYDADDVERIAEHLRASNGNR